MSEATKKILQKIKNNKRNKEKAGVLTRNGGYKRNCDHRSALLLYKPSRLPQQLPDFVI